jgi:hypothetical protein
MSVRIEDTIVEELAARFWSLARALDRLDRLESAQEFRGWLDRLGQDERQLEELSRTLVLHALGAALDPVNLRVLAHLRPDEPVSLADLSARCALGRVPLHLRLGILVQAGLAALELEKEAARGTTLGAALARWLEGLAADLNRAVAARLREGGGRGGG